MTTTRRRSRASLLLTCALILTMVVVLPGHADHAEAFHLQGDVTTTSEDRVDWTDFLQGPGDVNVKPSVPAGYIAAGASADYALPDTTTYTQGSKDTLDVDQWTCTRSNNVNNKVDITNAYSAARRNEAGDLLIFFGVEIKAPEGNSNIGMWFLKDPAACERSGGGSQAFAGQHEDGDVLVVSAFTNGGRTANISVYEWVGSGLVLRGEFAGATCDPAAPDGGINGSRHACAIANPDDPVETGWYSPNRRGEDAPLEPNTFFEGGVNITQLLGTEGQPEEECFTQFLANTRSSQSLTATLFDFTTGRLEICGGLTIVKETNPASHDQDFDFTITGPGIGSNDDEFTLNASEADEEPPGDRITFSNLLIGSYTITEVDIPAGWDLTDIDCDGGAPVYDEDGVSVTVTVGVDANITCTFTNRLRHSILVVKTDGSDLLGGAAFEATGPGDSDDDYTLDEGPDGIHCVDDLVPGTYSITETQTPTGYDANDNIPDVTTSSTATCTDRIAALDLDGDGTVADAEAAADRTVVNEPSPVDLTVRKWKLSIDGEGQLFRSTTPLGGFEFTLYEGGLDTDGNPSDDPDDIVGSSTTATSGESIGQTSFTGGVLEVGETYSVCETGVPTYGDDDDGYWTPAPCQEFTVALNTDVTLDFENAPRADVRVEFLDVTGYTSAEIVCYPAGGDPEEDGVSLSVPHGDADADSTLNLDKLDLGSYVCTIDIANGAAPTPPPVDD